MSLIVTGTGTGVGKTVACAVILARYGRRIRLAYWKPVATGADLERDADCVRRWCPRLASVLPELYLFDPPLSPHLAARLSGRTIDPEAIAHELVRHALADERRSILIEGAGGLLVPLTERGYLFADLIRDLHLPCLVAAASALGTINHTLLTIEAIRARGLELAGVVLGGPRNRGNREAIERFGKTRVIAEIEPMPRLGPAGVARAARSFDRKGILRRYLS